MGHDRPRAWSASKWRKELAVRRERAKAAARPGVDESRCAATSITERRQCVRRAVKRVAGAEYCTLHAKKYSKRETILALLCAEDVEVWDVARRTGATERLIRELLHEAWETKKTIRKALARYRSPSS